MDAGGRAKSGTLAEERKLEDSPSDGPGTNCTFTGNTEHIAKHMFRPDCQRTRAIIGLDSAVDRFLLDNMFQTLSTDNIHIVVLQNLYTRHPW